ncbi:MAG: hypothetical protein QOJ94_3045 [Sphingomonadales bacterium]|jgi:hypothetical protein|nr:hypothetical protein [Sphingomonadales bacterium]
MNALFARILVTAALGVLLYGVAPMLGVARDLQTMMAAFFIAGAAAPVILRRAVPEPRASVD